MIDALLHWWKWQRIPYPSGGSGKSLLAMLEKSPDRERALILVCVAHIRNKVYRDTGYDLLEDARRIHEKKDAFIPAGKAIWMMNGNTYPPFRRALTIWFFTVRVRSPDKVQLLCDIWKVLNKASPFVDGVISTVAEKLEVPINYDGFERIPKGICE